MENTYPKRLTFLFDPYGINTLRWIRVIFGNALIAIYTYAMRL